MSKKAEVLVGAHHKPNNGVMVFRAAETTSFCFCFHSIKKPPKRVKPQKKTKLMCVFGPYLGVV